MIERLLKELNRKSDMLFEIMTDGMEYTIYCESSVLEDEESGKLSGLSESDCIGWIKQFINEC